MFGSDINGDGSASDLMFIPKSGSEFNWGTLTATYKDANGVNKTRTFTAKEQSDAWDAFVAQDEYLNANKGKYAERYGALYPWYTRIDMRILQDFSFKIKDKKHTLQLSWDIINLPNLINSAWGVQKQLSIGGLSNNANYVRNTTGTSNPVYTLVSDANGTLDNYKSTFVNNNAVFSTWYMQLGARYTF